MLLKLVDKKKPGAACSPPQTSLEKLITLPKPPVDKQNPLQSEIAHTPVLHESHMAES